MGLGYSFSGFAMQSMNEFSTCMENANIYKYFPNEFNISTFLFSKKQNLSHQVICTVSYFFKSDGEENGHFFLEM